MVSVVLSAIAAGDTPAQIADDYGIPLDDVYACVDFARQEIDASSYRPASKSA